MKSESTPRGLRKHIALLGRTNAGKSTLFNLIMGQEAAIVSDKAGTTTDPVMKNMELIPFGPVTLIDTGGLEDTTELGKQRAEKTREFARRADIGIILTDAVQYDENNDSKDLFSFFSGEKIYVFSKCDLVDEAVLADIKKKYPDSVFVSKDNPDAIDNLKKAIIDKLNALKEVDEDTLIGNLLPYGSTVVMVIPIDSEAPKGRLILPQVQLIRDCLDHGIKAYVTRETELAEALTELKKIDLVVTDSQIFALVSKIVPADIPLTSFSMILANQKGNFEQFLNGTKHIENLRDGDKILMLEACTHNHTHEDIGRVKIPALLNKRTSKNLEYIYYGGYNMPGGAEDLEQYSMAILCGGCMINKAEVTARLRLLEDNNIPAVNYGVILAYLTGILDRVKTIFEK